MRHLPTIVDQETMIRSIGDSPDDLMQSNNLSSNAVGNRKYKYHKIKTILIQRIISGEYPMGSCLPSESQLVKEFGVSRVTIRQSLDLLQSMDILCSYQGKGHFVKNILAKQDLARLQGFGEIMAPLGVSAYSKLLKIERVVAPTGIADKLQIKPNTQAIQIIRLRCAVGKVMSIDISFFPIDIGEPLIKMDLEKQDIFHLIETKLGIEITYADIIMDLINPTDYVARHLGAAKDSHIMRIERLTHDIKSRPIDFEYIYCQPDTHQFKLRVSRW